MNTERPVDEEPKYKLSRYCDKPKKRRRRNDPNRKCAEQYSTERKNLKKKIWREDLAQPQRDPLTKLAKVFTSTTLSQISSMKTSSRIWILWFDQRIIYQPPLHPNPQRILLTGQTSASSNWFIPSLHVCNRKEEKKKPNGALAFFFTMLFRPYASYTGNESQHLFCDDGLDHVERNGVDLIRPYWTAWNWTLSFGLNAQWTGLYWNEVD